MEFVKQGVSARASRGKSPRLQPAFERTLEEARSSHPVAVLQQALRSSQQHHQALLRHMPAAFARGRLAGEGRPAPDFVFLEVNPVFEALLGLGTLPGRSLSSSIPGIRASELFTACLRVACGGEAERFVTHVEGLGGSFAVDLYRPAPGEFAMLLDVKMLRPDGSEPWVTVQGEAERNAAGATVRLRGTVEDISELKAMAEALQHHAEEAKISHRLVCMQEEDRRRLTRIVHDTISPNLAAAKVNLGILHAGQPSRLLKHLERQFSDIRALLEDADTGIRDLCSELRPPLLDFAGLHAAVDGYARRISARTGLPVSVTGTESITRLPEEVETTLFRIVQEALTNCAQHARARQVSVRLWQNTRHASVSICDDGVGFDPASVREGAHGIQTMRERAEFIGARFKLDSHAGEGTRISVEI